MYKNIAIFVAAVGSAWLGMVFFRYHPPRSSADWSGWVQAVGSIAAIVGAWLAVRHQLNHAEKLRQLGQWEADLATSEACEELARDVGVVLWNIKSKFVAVQEGKRRRIGTERLEEVQQALRIMLHNKMPATLYIEVLRLQREVAYTLTAVRDQNTKKTISDQRIANAQKRAVKVDSIAQNISSIRCHYRQKLKPVHKMDH